MYECKAGFNVWRALKSLNDFFDEKIKPVAQKHGLTVMQLKLLCTVKSMDRATIGSVAEHTGIAAANASAMCKKLSELGYLIRKRMAEDDRVVCLELTSNGDIAAEEAGERIEGTYKDDVLRSFWEKLSIEMSSRLEKSDIK